MPDDTPLGAEVPPRPDGQTPNLTAVVDVREATAEAPPGARPSEGGGGRQSRHVVPEDLLEDDLPPPWPTITVGDADESPERLRVALLRTAYLGPAAALVLVALAIAGLHSPLGIGLYGSTVAAMVLVVMALLVAVVGRAHALYEQAQSSRPRGGPAPSVGWSHRDPTTADLNRQSWAVETRITSYQELAIRQARSSFRYSQTAMMVALGILTTGAVSVMVWSSGNAQVIVGLLTALGSGFSAFLGKTFLDARNRAIDQLNRSHAIPLAEHLAHFSYLLAERTDDATRDRLISHIVQCTMTGFSVALTGLITNPGMPAEPEPPPPISTEGGQGGA